VWEKHRGLSADQEACQGRYKYKIIMRKATRDIKLNEFTNFHTCKNSFTFLPFKVILSESTPFCIRCMISY